MCSNAVLRENERRGRPRRQRCSAGFKTQGNLVLLVLSVLGKKVSAVLPCLSSAGRTTRTSSSDPYDRRE